MKVGITIVDDSLNDIEKLKDLLTPHFLNDDIKFTVYMNPLDINYSIHDDIYFIDIDMPLKDGYHVAKDIYEYHPTAKIIFCTMHDDFVYTSFQFNPFYFVRKSHLKEDLGYAINKYKLKSKKEYLILTSEYINKQVLLSNIIYLESQRNYTVIHLFENDDEIRVRESLKNIQISLNNSFIKIAKGIIVNAAYIKYIKNNSITLKTNTNLSISRSLKKEVINKYNQFIIEE